MPPLQELQLLLPFLRRAQRVDIVSGLMLGSLLFLCYVFQVEGLARTSSNRNAFICGLNVLIVPLLGLLAVQVATGLVADDEIASTGPLVRFVESATSLAATSWHKSWGQWLLLGLVALHVAAIAVYRLVHRRDLVTPMLVGDKPLPPDVPASADHAGRWGLALIALSLGVALALWVQAQGG